MKKAILQTTLIILTCLALGFIFYNSLQGASSSSVSSGNVTNKVQEIVQKVAPTVTVKESLVRNLAHISEFALFAFLLTLTYKSFEFNKNKHFYIPLSIVAVIPLVDELLQLIPKDRAFQFQDMCLDWLGESVGIACAVVIVLIVFAILKKKKQQIANKEGNDGLTNLDK